jgi:transcriptional regulator with XRE-family HTH domain
MMARKKSTSSVSKATRRGRRSAAPQKRHRAHSVVQDASPAALVGAMLREQRRLLNLTLQEVADRAGITKGFLSEIERDKAIPSVATLMRLRDALSLSISSLFRSSLPRVVRSTERQTIPFGGEGMVCSLVSARDAHRVTVIWADLEPGGRSGAEPHSLDADEEVIIVVSGALEISVDGGESHRLRAGDSFNFDPRLPHRYENPSSSQVARVVCIVAPPPK